MRAIFSILFIGCLAIPESYSRPGEPPSSKTTLKPEIHIQTLDDQSRTVPLAPAANGTIQVPPVVQDPETVTSVPKKGVDIEKGVPSVPKKGVNEEQSGKSGKKDLDMKQTSPDRARGVVPKKGVEEDKPSMVSGRKGAQPSSTKAFTTEAPLLLRASSAKTDLPVPKPSTTSQPVFVTSTALEKESKGVIATHHQGGSGSLSSDDHVKDLTSLKASPKNNQQSTETQDMVDPSDGGTTSMVVGVVFGMILLGVLLFVGLKRLDAIRRRREYRKMNDFLIDGMYNDL